MSDARAIAEETARASYGRLLAWLCARTGDVAAAEDALAEAFKAALEHWPEKGAPAAPEAWIVTTARRKLIDQSRRRKTSADAAPALLLAAEEAEAEASADAPFPDERLKLMLICAHPAIDAGVRTPLMLQTVLGLDAARIASAFLVSPKAMGARLVRAKRKIKQANIPFEPPSLDIPPERLSAVLDAVYAAFGTGWNDFDGADGSGDGLTHEAIYLAKLLTTLAPDEAEAWGLLSLMLHAEARAQARRVGGVYVPLNDQDTARWNFVLIEKAEGALARAFKLQRPGRYQIEAAIQSAHAASRLYGRDVAEDVILLYQRLMELAPSLGAQVGFAAALSNAGRNADAFALLENIDEENVDAYQPYWAVRAHVLCLLGRRDESRGAYDRAIGLAADAGVRAFLHGRRQALGVSA